MTLRGKQVILDRDLAELYQVKKRVLNQAVKKNSDRFPDDFIFQVTKEKFSNWKSQIVTSNNEIMVLRLAVGYHVNSHKATDYISDFNDLLFDKHLH